ncbi:MAG: competence protein ComE [Betaproteobacteria bacterium HGW-Betaproteobacteria-8]|nr:MAG: competence protein ComE [Betaproteobacteria bacterium HGW-Betaproteobacteria-8]
MKKLLLIVASVIAFSVNPAFAAVDINTATAAQLESVDGIGPKKAEAIIEYRKKNGQFKSVDELENVKGLGKASIEKMRNELTVGAAKKTAAAPAKK